MLIGNVGKDPELKFTPSGIPVTSFRLATSETWKDREGSVREHTDWHTIVAWRGLAEVINKLVNKGSRVHRLALSHAEDQDPREGGERIQPDGRGSPCNRTHAKGNRHRRRVFRS